MAIPSEWAGLPVSPTLPYLRVSKVCLMPPGHSKMFNIKICHPSLSYKQQRQKYINILLFQDNRLIYLQQNHRLLNNESSSSRTDLSANLQQLIASQLLFFHSFTTFRERGKTGEDGIDAQVPLSVPLQPPTTTTTPPTLTDEKVGGRKERKKNLRKLSHTHTHAHSDLDQ